MNAWFIETTLFIAIISAIKINLHCHKPENAVWVALSDDTQTNKRLYSGTNEVLFAVLKSTLIYAKAQGFKIFF